VGRFHFLDGTPTAVTFDLDHDEARVLHWCGLPSLDDGEDQWFDLAAQPAENERPPSHSAHVGPVHTMLSHGTFQTNGSL
jgi:hypothetical protein